MISITIPAGEIYDDEKGEFVYLKKDTTISLEHSLMSISKWESRWHKPFLGNEQKSIDETIDYIKCMTITQNVDKNAYRFLTPDNITAVNAYIEDPMTATTINDESGRPSREIVTSEIIYYWMIAMGIPSEYQKWHLNRLLTLIRVCSIKNSPKKKMSAAEINARNKALNDARRKKLHTKG